MKKIMYLSIIATACIASNTTFAGAAQFDNEKMHCAIFKNGKLAKQQTCVADGYEHAGAGYGGGAGWDFRKIAGYGKISVDTGVKFAENQTNADGSSVVEEEWLNLNGKPAVQRHRIAKSYQILTPTQEKNYYDNGLKDKNGKDIKVYSCLYQKANPNFEFCFDQQF